MPTSNYLPYKVVTDMNSKLQKELFGIINNRNLNIKDPIFKRQIKSYFTKFKPNRTHKSRSLSSPTTMVAIMENETMPVNMKKKLIHAAVRNMYDFIKPNMNLAGKSVENVKGHLAERRKKALHKLENAFAKMNAANRSNTRKN